MGGCCSSQSQQGNTEQNNLDRNKHQRQSNWTATGTIALRDSNLKVQSKTPHEFTVWPSMLRGNLTPRILEPLFPKSDLLVLCLQALPSAAFGVDPAARVLDVTNNHLTYLPDQISGFTNLSRLILASNQLNALPPCLSQLRSLKVNCNIVSAQSSFVLQMTPTELCTESSSQTCTAPLGRMMQVLVLDSNRLTSLPTDIGQLFRLEKLSVKENALVTVPVSINQLQKLSVLDLSSNSLAELTAAVAECSQLEELNVSNNDLQVYCVTTAVSPTCCPQTIQDIHGVGDM